MATVHVKDVPDPVYQAVKRRAARAGRSMASEIRCILQEAVAPTRMPKQVVRSIDRVRRRYGAKVRGADADRMIREDRSR